MAKRVEGLNKSYENIEVSCSEASCAPCTYPNCQRYVGIRKSERSTFAK